MFNRFYLRPLMLLACLVAPVQAQAMQVDDEDLRPGVQGTYRDSTGREHQSVDERLAFDWSGAAPARSMAEGSFSASWKGFLMSQTPGEYRFAAMVAGEVTIRLAGKTILEAKTSSPKWVESEPLELDFDYHPLIGEFHGDTEQASFSLFWSGPQFPFEPIGHRYFFHEEAGSLADFQYGAELVRALRCAACHEIPGEGKALRAPALGVLTGNLHPGWLVRQLRSDNSNSPARRMPHFKLTDEEAHQIAAYVFASTSADKSKPRPQPKKKKQKVDPLKSGKELLLTSGCLACHQHQRVGNQGWFGGGDFDQIAAKRPAGFFARWLADPSQVNSKHRMPRFEFSSDQRHHLDQYLSQQGTPPAPIEYDDEDVARGLELVRQHRCDSCHEMPFLESHPPKLTRLGKDSDWDRGCLQATGGRVGQPGYRLDQEETVAIRSFLGRVAEQTPVRTAQSILRENNCLTCHGRDTSPGFTPIATAIAAMDSEFAPLVPAMVPPSLESVGDKLTKDILRGVLQKKSSPYRDYLKVQMPRFPLTEAEQVRVVNHFVATDRIPGVGRTPHNSGLDDLALRAAGGRLVTTDGFGCTSCHQVGSVRPTKAPLNARGPALSGIGKRIRREWFDRFVANPARIVPRMEMPSVQLAVRGVLEDDLQQQLSAVWEVLNRPGFEPPRANPLRVVRNSGLAGRAERANVITDLIRYEDRVFIKPFMVGLPNRHNLLLDLETAQLKLWTLGDTARQYTAGKTWFWEAGGISLLENKGDSADIMLSVGSKVIAPSQPTQFKTEIHRYEHTNEEGDRGVTLSHLLRFEDGQREYFVRITQEYLPLAGDAPGFVRRVQATGLPPESTLLLGLVDSGNDAVAVDPKERLVELSSQQARVSLTSDGGTLRKSGVVSVPVKAGRAEVQLEYRSSQSADQFPVIAPEIPLPEPTELSVVPGFRATRLPLIEEVMPTGLGWRAGTGELFLTSLKGRVWAVTDTDGDGLEDRLRAFSDELAAPYGLAVHPDFVDVINKYGVLRLRDRDGDGVADLAETVAAGWGHTADYHDWAVGLPSDEDGNYYVALPCQQDERSERAADFRGAVLKLIPREPTAENPHRFAIHRVSGGHRFPMGIARNRAGQLFVTDNQGNYNPFNELNHVRQDRRYGFINRLERKPGFEPALTPPSIDIPHPWTRSVNGICFLETPRSIQKSAFGPFEGHLVGCEYDTRRLIRMTVHNVQGTMQGAAYPFSYEVPTEGPPLLGPLACAVSPQGELYVGGIRDSGWGGANNIGEVVRLAMEDLPCGIREVRAVPDGFEISFTQPVDKRLAAQAENFTVSSYTRVSTPAYGGADRERRSEGVRNIRISSDGLSLVLDVGPRRAGFVYEFRVKNLAGDGAQFFPAEAYYTLRVIPE